jgi:GTP-binding protein
VALLVLDASEGLTGEDKRVAARVGESGRGLVVVLNKWDLVPSEERDDRFTELNRALALFPGTPVLRTSARTGLGVTRLLPSLLSVHAAWTKRVPTSEVNRALEAAQAANPVPRRAGRILYGTQVGAGPPRFVVFGAADPGPAYRRYLENALRTEFGFQGVPIRLSFRPRRGRRAGRNGRDQRGRRRSRTAR